LFWGEKRALYDLVHKVKVFHTLKLIFSRIRTELVEVRYVRRLGKNDVFQVRERYRGELEDRFGPAAHTLGTRLIRHGEVDS
jgi:hypothetical protein